MSWATPVPVRRPLTSSWTESFRRLHWRSGDFGAPHHLLSQLLFLSPGGEWRRP